MNYYEVMENLPLEILDPKTLLEYLPPGSNAKTNKSEFWLRFQKLMSSGNESEFEKVLFDSEVYERIAREYIYQVN